MRARQLVSSRFPAYTPQPSLALTTMQTRPPLPTIALGEYRHFKGGRYEVLGVVRSSETLEPLVLYRPLDNGVGLWVRPYAMFLEQVNVDGAMRPRFAPVA
ncbi:hypothetical protein FHR50_002606 [Xanthomonas arboricola]